MSSLFGEWLSLPLPPYYNDMLVTLSKHYLSEPPVFERFLSVFIGSMLHTPDCEKFKTALGALNNLKDGTTSKQAKNIVAKFMQVEHDKMQQVCGLQHVADRAGQVDSVRVALRSVVSQEIMEPITKILQSLKSESPRIGKVPNLFEVPYLTLIKNLTSPFLRVLTNSPRALDRLQFQKITDQLQRIVNIETWPFRKYCQTLATRTPKEFLGVWTWYKKGGRDRQTRRSHTLVWEQGLQDRGTSSMPGWAAEACKAFATSIDVQRDFVLVGWAYISEQTAHSRAVDQSQPSALYFYMVHGIPHREAFQLANIDTVFFKLYPDLKSEEAGQPIQRMPQLMRMQGSYALLAKPYIERWQKAYPQLTNSEIDGLFARNPREILRNNKYAGARALAEQITSSLPPVDKTPGAYIQSLDHKNYINAFSRFRANEVKRNDLMTEQMKALDPDRSRKLAVRKGLARTQKRKSPRQKKFAHKTL